LSSNNNNNIVVDSNKENQFQERIIELENEINDKSTQFHQLQEELNKSNLLVKSLKNEVNNIDDMDENKELKDDSSINIDSDLILKLTERAEKAEQELRANQLKYLNDSKISPIESNNNDELITLKQSILKLDSDREKLLEDIDQRDRKIELLENEMKGPIPFEMKREKLISELETRNSDLKQQIWELESDLEEKSNSITPNLYNSNTQIDYMNLHWNIVVNTTNSMVNGLGIEVGSDLAICIDARVDFSERVSIVNNTIKECAETMYSAIGNCSDIAEGVDIDDLEGEEGTITRLISCVEKSCSRLSEVADERAIFEDNYNDIVEEMKALDRIRMRLEEDIEIFELELSNKSNELLSNNKEMEALLLEVNDAKMKLDDKSTVTTTSSLSTPSSSPTDTTNSWQHPSISEQQSNTNNVGSPSLVSSLREQVATLRRSIGDLQKESIEKEKENKRIILELEKDNGLLRDDYEDIESYNVKYSEKINSLEIELATKSQELDRLVGIIDTKNENIYQLNCNIEQLSTNSTSNNLVHELQQQNDIQLHEINNFTNKIIDLTNEKQRIELEFINQSSINNDNIEGLNHAKLLLNNKLLVKSTEIDELNEIITNLQHSNDENMTANSKLNFKLNEFSNIHDELIANKDINEAFIENLRKELDSVTNHNNTITNGNNSNDDDDIANDNNSNEYMIKLEEQRKSYEEDRINNDVKINNLTSKVDQLITDSTNLSNIIDENNIIIKALKANEIFLIESNDNTKQLNESLSVQLEEFENNVIPNLLSERSNFEIKLNSKTIELETITSEMNCCQTMLDAQTQDNCTLSLELQNRKEFIKSLEINISDNSINNQQLQELIHNNNDVINQKNNELEILEKKLYNNDIKQVEINDSLNIELSVLKEENNDYKLQCKNIQDDINIKTTENKELFVKYNELLNSKQILESAISNLKAVNEAHKIEKSELEVMLGKLEANDHTIEAYVAQRHG
jgi:chromosome segregation ATPase